MNTLLKKKSKSFLDTLSTLFQPSKKLFLYFLFGQIFFFILLTSSFFTSFSNLPNFLYIFLNSFNAFLTIKDDSPFWSYLFTLCATLLTIPAFFSAFLGLSTSKIYEELLNIQGILFDSKADDIHELQDQGQNFYRYNRTWNHYQKLSSLCFTATGIINLFWITAEVILLLLSVIVTKKDFLPGVSLFIASLVAYILLYFLLSIFKLSISTGLPKLQSPDPQTLTEPFYLKNDFRYLTQVSLPFVSSNSLISLRKANSFSELYYANIHCGVDFINFNLHWEFYSKDPFNPIESKSVKVDEKGKSPHNYSFSFSIPDDASWPLKLHLIISNPESSLDSPLKAPYHTMKIWLEKSQMPEDMTPKFFVPKGTTTMFHFTDKS